MRRALADAFSNLKTYIFTELGSPYLILRTAYNVSYTGGELPPVGFKQQFMPRAMPDYYIEIIIASFFGFEDKTFQEKLGSQAFQQRLHTTMAAGDRFKHPGLYLGQYLPDRSIYIEGGIEAVLLLDLDKPQPVGGGIAAAEKLCCLLIRQLNHSSHYIPPRLVLATQTIPKSHYQRL
jgi:hypothetical protein